MERILFQWSMKFIFPSTILISIFKIQTHFSLFNTKFWIFKNLQTNRVLKAMKWHFRLLAIYALFSHLICILNITLRTLLHFSIFLMRTQFFHFKKLLFILCKEFNIKIWKASEAKLFFTQVMTRLSYISEE